MMGNLINVIFYLQVTQLCELFKCVGGNHINLVLMEPSVDVIK